MRILLVGDSQAAGPPGASAEARLRALGHQTARVAMVSRGPISYMSNQDNLWSRYVEAARELNPDAVLLIFGSNNPASSVLRDALTRMKNAVRAPVYLSGPPHYGDTGAQDRGAAIREVYKAVFPGTRFIDPYPWTGAGVPRTPDGLHFTAASGSAWGVPLADELDRRMRASPLASGPSDRVDRSGPGGSNGTGTRGPMGGSGTKRGPR